MNLRIKTEDSITNLTIPCREETINNLCEAIGIPNTAASEVSIGSVYMDDRANALFANKTLNLDKLNYLAKRLDSLDSNEQATFYAVAYSEKLEDMDSLINLTFNTHCWGMVTDFNDLNAVGKRLYLTEQGAVSTADLDRLNGEKYFASVLESNQNPGVTPYGIIFKNNNEYEDIFDGTHFPQYEWKRNMGTVTLGKDGFPEYLYLPFEKTELEKAVERLGAGDIQQCTAELESELLSDEIIRIMTEGEDMRDKLQSISDLSKRLEEIGSREKPHLDFLVEQLNPKNETDLTVLMDNMFEFEVYHGIRTAEQYGIYMICDSGRYEYDENIHEYIDFERYGNDRLKMENGAFTPDGYLLYHGHNRELSEMLQGVGIELGADQTQTLKLYMPLKAITYHEENGYGDMIQVDYEVDIHPYDLDEYEDEILNAIERNGLPEEQKRGMMEYYGETDTVNAKVKRYDFTVERVGHALMGVAVLELNAPLNDKELATIKETITGNVSDGWGEGFEQREIKTDDGREIYVSFWQSGNWSLQTADELGIKEPRQELTMGDMKL